MSVNQKNLRTFFPPFFQVSNPKTSISMILKTKTQTRNLNFHS